MKPKIISYNPDFHQVTTFDCGNVSLNTFLTQTALRFINRGDAKVYVLVDLVKESTVLGFYSLSNASVPADDLPLSLAKKRPNLPAPLTLLGRMGVDISLQGQGFGEILLRDAMQKVLDSPSGTIGLLVDAKPEALAFYLKYGFLPFPEQPLRLILPLKSIQALVSFSA